jgi:LmbE family N-acetylglucosaminyl deacetylase
VFFGDGYYNHRDHRITGWAALDAIAPAAGNPHYFSELRAEGLDVHSVATVYLSGTLEPNAWVDITATLERKIEALFCHASQLVETGDWFRQFLRDSAEAAGRAAASRTRRRSAVSRSLDRRAAARDRSGGRVRVPLRLRAQHEHGDHACADRSDRSAGDRGDPAA